MEDATVFSWQGAKAAQYTMLLCEMEREDLDQIDRIRKAHAKKYVSVKANWMKPSDPGKKP